MFKSKTLSVAIGAILRSVSEFFCYDIFHIYRIYFQTCRLDSRVQICFCTNLKLKVFIEIQVAKNYLSGESDNAMVFKK